MSAQTAAASDRAPDFAERPLWLDDLTFQPPPAERLPPAVDVLVVGAGYTGLSAAAVTAAAGRDTLVLDAEPFGFGCSARNGGQVAPGVKPGVAALTPRIGDEAARAIHREGLAALAGLGDLVRREALDCDWTPAGRLVGAHTAKTFDGLVRSYEAYARMFDRELIVVPRPELHAEIGTDSYHGAVVQPGQAAVHPAKLLQALATRASGLGARIVDRCAVQAIARDGDGFRVRTPLGEVRARDVVLATNGYTGPLSPWHRARVIPIRTSMIATEHLEPGLMDRLMPTRRNVVDTRRLVIYFRVSPDGRRLVFGGRASLFDSTPQVFVPRLLGWLRRIFPVLAATRVSRAWSGVVAYTFDALPHIGSHDGVHYAMGYCGSGIALSTHFGRKLGLKVLGDPAGATAVDDLPFQTRPFYSGTPWFLAPSVAGFRLLDALGL